MADEYLQGGQKIAPYVQDVSVPMKDRQGRDVKDHTTTHRPPDDPQSIPNSNTDIAASTARNNK